LLVVAIRRAGQTIFPTPDTRLESRDVLTVVADPAREAALKAFFDPPLAVE
jgi:Trk K+ transport system NAD-binding subunit